MEPLDRRIARVANSAVRRQLGAEVHSRIQRQDFEGALRICDALIFFPDIDLPVLCNALWVVQPDNTGLHLDEAMAKRFLAASVFRAGFNPAMHINAAAVYAHLGDPEPVLRHLLLAKQHQQDIAPYLQDPLFDRARRHPRWCELTGSHEPIDEPSWMEVALETCEAGEYANAFPALWWFWSRTRSSRVADLVEAVSERAGVRIGYRSEDLEEALRSSPESLREEFYQSSRRDYRVDGSPAHDDAHDELVWLAQDATDPRFASAALRLLGSTRWPGKKTVQDGLRELLANLEALRDKRIAPGLAALSQDLLESSAPVDSWLACEVARLSGALAAMPEPTLTETENRACSRLEELIGLRTSELGYCRPEVSPPCAAKKQVDPLLALWRTTRNPAVAEVLDLQHMRTPPVPDLEQKIRATVIPGEGSERDVGAFDGAQVIWEAKQEDDPRLASALIRLFDDPPFIFASRQENGVEDYWAEVVSACVSLGDVRLVAPLRALAARFLSLTREADAEANLDMYMAFPPGPPVKRQLLKCANEIEAAAQERPLDDAQQALLDAARAEYAPEEAKRALERQRGEERGDTAESLMEKILAEPDNDAPRLAYADFLGDAPRARFIRLQVERAAAGKGDLEAERALQSKYQLEWVEPLAHLLDDLVFERGFLASCTVSIDSLGDPLAPEWVHPILATLRSIRSDSDTWRSYDWDTSEKVPSNFVDAIATMPALTELDGVSSAGLLDLVERGHTHYTLITIEPKDIDESLWPSLVGALAQMTELQTLRVRVSRRQELEGLASLLEANALSHLALEVDAYDASTTDITLPIAQEFLGGAFKEITFAWKANNHDTGIDRCELRFTKSGERWSIEAAQLDDRLPHEFEEPARAATQLWLGPFITQLEQLPRDAVSAFRLADSTAAPSRSSLDALSALLASFSHLETVELAPAGDSPGEIQRLIAALEDPEQVEHACRVLGSYKDPTARVELAHHAAHNEVLSVRCAAIEALAEMADETVVPVLCDGLDETPAGLMSARLLGYLRAKSAIPALLEYAPSVDMGFDWNHMAQAFTRIADPEAIPVLLERYQKEASSDTLVALGRLGAPEAREFALAALESGADDGAFAALAFVGQPEDCELLERFFESREGVTHIRGVPLLASLAIAADATEAHIDMMATAIEKSWSSGVSEDCAWLALELGTRLDGPGAKWKNFAEQVLQWCEGCLAWSERIRADTPVGLNAREWSYWEDLLCEVATVWR